MPIKHWQGSIKKDIQWLGADWEDRLYFASNYFEQMYEAAVKLIKKGKAFVCDLTAEEMDRFDKDYIPVITMGYYGGWNKDPNELAEQQQKVLDTFGANKDKFIVVGVRPMDGSVDIPEYERVMKETWGEHYISTIDICTVTTTTADGQTQVADALYDKLLELGYIVK